MLRHITFLVAGIALGAVGTVAVENGMLSPHNDHGSHAIGAGPYLDLSDDRKNIWPDDLPVPTLDLEIEPDPASGHNLLITTDGFRMTPEDVNGPVEAGTGHGHLFVNGKNIGRLYANVRHLIDLPKGEVTIHMYLGGNDHKVWVANGQPLFVEETFFIE